MILKSISSLFVVLLISLAHAGCCLLPVFAVAAGSISYFAGFMQYKSFFTFIQLFVFVYISIRLIRFYWQKEVFHSRLEKVSFQIGFLAAALGLMIGYFEPLKTENQRIAQQQFQFFKSHRHTEFGISGKYDPVKLRSDIMLIKGIKPGRIQIQDTTFSVTFQSELVTQAQILYRLKRKGYEVTVQ